MTIEAAAISPPPPRLALRRGTGGAFLPIATILVALLALWYAGAVALNAPFARQIAANAGRSLSLSELIAATWSQERPVLPAPHQVATEFWNTTVAVAPTSRRSLLNHAWVTLSAALLGFAIGSIFGIVLAVLIVHLRTLRQSLLPWIIASQTVPILAVAPIVIVVLGSLGLTGLVPKSIISAYLCFFPVTIGMVAGLNSPDAMQTDLMRTFSAAPSQIFWKLRLPASVPFLFASLKVAAAISLVGAIVGELPTGAQAGLGARLLAGSYYGQTVQIWSALFMAAILGGLMVVLIGAIERILMRWMGARPEAAR